jgi:hypothetical protein
LQGRIILSGLLATAALAAIPTASGASKNSTGTGTVFFPNPVAQLQDQSLTDQKDADYAAFSRRIATSLARSTVAATQSLYGKSAATAVTKAFADRGIL